MGCQHLESSTKPTLSTQTSSILTRKRERLKGVGLIDNYAAPINLFKILYEKFKKDSYILQSNAIIQR